MCDIVEYSKTHTFSSLRSCYKRIKSKQHLHRIKQYVREQGAKFHKLQSVDEFVYMEHQRKAQKFYYGTLLSNQSDHYIHCILLIIDNCIGSIYFAQNDLTKAIDYYTKLLEKKSNFSCFYGWTMNEILDRFLYFARFWKESGQFELIIRLFDSLEQMKTINSSLDAYFLVWLEYYSIADDKLFATNFLDLVISIGCSENGSVKMSDELKLQSMQKNEAFIEKIAESKRLDYNHTMYGRIGILYSRLKRMDLALSWFERAIDECPEVEVFDGFNSPNKCTYLMFLSRFYRENNEFDRSWDYLEQAHKIRCQIPVDKEGMQRLKNNYYLEAVDISKRKMNFVEAIEYCQKALDNDSKCVKTFEQLADVYERLGNYALAKECYLKAVELTPRYDELTVDRLDGRVKTMKNYWNKIRDLNEKEQTVDHVL